jgi:hypothetical protein
MERTVKKVKVLTSKGKAVFTLMEQDTFKKANALKVRANSSGYLYFKDENGVNTSFVRWLLGVTDDDLVVSYKNGNHRDLRLENLEVITKAERGKRNLASTKQQKVEDKIYFLFNENKFMVSVYLPDGTHRCPRAKTLDAARILRDRLMEIHNIK